MKLKEYRKNILKILDQYSTAGEINNKEDNLAIADYNLKIDSSIDMALNQVHNVYPFTKHFIINSKYIPNFLSLTNPPATEYLIPYGSFSFKAFAVKGSFTLSIFFIDKNKNKTLISENYITSTLFQESKNVEKSKDYESILFELKSEYFFIENITIYEGAVDYNELKLLPIYKDNEYIFNMPEDFLVATNISNAFNKSLKWQDNLLIVKSLENLVLDIEYKVSNVNIKYGNIEENSEDIYQNEIILNQELKVRKGLENAVIYYAAALNVPSENPTLYNSLMRMYQDTLINYQSGFSVGTPKIKIRSYF